MSNMIDLMVQWLSTNSEWALIIVYLIGFLESLVLVGLVIPGSIAIASIGILIGTGALPLISTLFAASLGAISGGVLSFFIGKHFKDSIHTKWPFTNFQHIIKKGELFFATHGKKSVFLGRFVGPIRPILPLIAGSLNMSTRAFVITDIISGLIWAPLYMLPGAFVTYTGYSLDYKSKTIIYYSMVLLALTLVGFWIYKYLIKRQLIAMHNYILKHWQNIKTKQISIYPKLNIIIPIEKSNANTPILLIIGLFSFMVFLSITYLVLQQGTLVQFDQKTLQYFQSLHLLDYQLYIKYFTHLADPLIMIGLYITVLIYLFITKNHTMALVWFTNGAMAGGGAYIIKCILNLPRPEYSTIERVTSSFPSAHTTLVIIILGMLYHIISSKKSYLRLITLVTFMLCIMASRLLLSAHWLSDILGGITWAMTCLVFNLSLMQGTSLEKEQQQMLAKIVALTISGLWLFQIFI